MAGGRALVVDDDVAISTLLSAVVAHQGYAVESAEDGEDAIRQIDDDGPFSLIVLDLMRPRVDGFAVLAHMKSSRPELLRCTIIASAVPEDEIRRTVPDPIFKIHIKPFDMTRLIADIRSCTV